MWAGYRYFDYLCGVSYFFIIIMRKFISFLACIGLVAMAAGAQELSNFSFGRGQRVVSPEINGAKTTFRIKADTANSINLVGNWMETPDSPGVPMTKGAEGMWEVTIDTPSPEIYTYSFVVDGVAMNDPLNVFVQRDGNRYLSMLTVPGERSENYKEAGKHGTVAHRWYHSDILGMDRRLTVYTPAGYEEGNGNYPVLYLLHGAGGDEEAWSSMGRAAQILDNLIEKGLAEPMICVMPNGNPNQMAAQTLGMTVAEYDRNDPAMRNAYVRSLCEEIVPFTEKNYRADSRPEKRAIAGLSMGGAHTIAASSLYPELFDYICPLSAAGAITPEQAKGLKDAGVKLYWQACGNTDFLWDRNMEIKKALEDAQMDNYVFFESDGGHVWSNWRYYLNNFAPLLFK